jgi:hypothetical protein
MNKPGQKHVFISRAVSDHSRCLKGNTRIHVAYGAESRLKREIQYIFDCKIPNDTHILTWIHTNSLPVRVLVKIFGQRYISCRYDDGISREQGAAAICSESGVLFYLWGITLNTINEARMLLHTGRCGIRGFQIFGK